MGRTYKYEISVFADMLAERTDFRFERFGILAIAVQAKEFEFVGNLGRWGFGLTLGRHICCYFWIGGIIDSIIFLFFNYK